MAYNPTLFKELRALIKSWRSQYTFLTFVDADNQPQIVSAAYPMPSSGSGGGGGNVTLLAGSAIAGKFGIDQTTQFTTNAITIVGAITKTDRSGTITTGGTSQQLMSANASRKGWQLQNNSTGAIAFNELGNAASLTSGSFILQPGSTYESPVGAISTAQINVIGATTGQAFTAREW